MTPYATSSGSTASTEAVARSEDEEPIVVLLLFAAARVAAGTAREEIRGSQLRSVLETARARFGAEFSAIVDRARVWVNGEPAELDRLLAPGDEVAVLPPVSGGSGSASP